MPDTLRPALAAWLSAQEGRPVEVDGVTVASTGARRVNALFEARADGTAQRLALTMIPTAAIQLLDIRDEAGVRQLAESAGVPVPHVHHVCSDDSVLGGPFFISTAVDGETVPRRVLRLAARARSRRAHRRSARRRDGETAFDRPGRGTGDHPPTRRRRADRHRDSRSSTRQLELLIEPSPVFAYAARWLERNAPRRARRPGDRPLRHPQRQHHRRRRRPAGDPRLGGNPRR